MFLWGVAECRIGLCHNCEPGRCSHRRRACAPGASCSGEPIWQVLLPKCSQPPVGYWTLCVRQSWSTDSSPTPTASWSCSEKGAVQWVSTKQPPYIILISQWGCKGLGNLKSLCGLHFSVSPFNHPHTLLLSVLSNLECKFFRAGTVFHCVFAW